MKKAFKITVQGRVQGVGFRYYTKQKADELKVSGFVQNRPDGSVYIEAEGEENDLLEFISWCHKGPQWSRVQEVTIGEVPPLGVSEFTVR